MSDFPTAPPPPPPFVPAPALDPGSRPTTVAVVFWLALVAAALRLVSGIVALAQIDQTTRVALHTEQGLRHVTLSETQIRAAVVGGAIAGGILSLAIIVLLVLCAFFVRRGAGWARIVLTVVAGVSLLSALTPLGAIGAVLLIACVVLVWLPATNRWFRAVKARRRPAVG